MKIAMKNTIFVFKQIVQYAGIVHLSMKKQTNKQTTD